MIAREEERRITMTTIDRIKAEMKEYDTLKNTAKFLDGITASTLKTAAIAKDASFPYLASILNPETGTYRYYGVKSRLIAYLEGQDIGREKTIVLVSPDGVMPSQTMLRKLLGVDA